LGREWIHRVEDILGAIAEIQSFVAGMTDDEFGEDARTLKAVAADLMIIGEAANHVPDEVQEASPEVPWAVMSAMRNRIVHVYFDVDAGILWDTVQDDLPKLIEPLRALIRNPPA
jgi:uncharacterized protein with HEPN domain